MLSAKGEQCVMREPLWWSVRLHSQHGEYWVQYMGVQKSFSLVVPWPCPRQSPTDFKSANPKILGLILLSQIRKFLRYASCQSANCKSAFFLLLNPKIANLPIFCCSNPLIANQKFFPYRAALTKLALKSSLSLVGRCMGKPPKIRGQSCSVNFFSVQIWI